MSYDTVPTGLLSDALSDSTKVARTLAVPMMRKSSGAYSAWPASSDGHPLIELVDPSTAFGEVAVANMTPMTQVSFTNGINTELVTVTKTGTGAESSTTALGIVSTGASASSTCKITTRRYVPYRMGQGMSFRLTGSFTAGVAGSVQQLGASSDGTDGYGVGFNGTSFGFFHRQNSSTTWYPLSEYGQPNSPWIDPLDGSGPSGMDLDPTLPNIYFISVQHLGTGRIQVSIEDDSTGMLIPVLKMQRANMFSVPTIYQPNLAPFISVENTTNSTNIVAKCICLAGFIEGTFSSLGVQRFQRATKPTVGAASPNPTPIISLRNPVTGGGNYVTHRVPLIVREVNGASTGNQAGEITVWANATLTSASFADVANTNTPAQIDTAASALTGGRLLYSAPVGANVATVLRKEYKVLEVVMEPGDIITIAAESYTSTSTYRCGIGWEDLV